MIDEQIAGAIVVSACSFLCSILFLGLGICASRSDKPVNFWSGKNVDPQKVTDVHAYNFDCSRMWKAYSIPYWLAGVCAILSAKWELFIYFSIAALVLACVPGIPMLIRRYIQIEKRYILR